MYSFYGWTMTWFLHPYDDIISQDAMGHLHSTPCCLLSFIFCSGKRSPTVKQIQGLKYGMGQLGIIQVILMIVLIVADIEGKYDTFYYPLKILSLVSLMTCVYSVNVLVKLTTNLIPERNMFQKSRTLLVLVVLVNIQGIILSALGSYGVFEDDPTYTAETKARLWDSILQLAECFLYGILLNKYWPVHENVPTDVLTLS